MSQMESGKLEHGEAEVVLGENKMEEIRVALTRTTKVSVAVQTSNRTRGNDFRKYKWLRRKELPGCNIDSCIITSVEHYTGCPVTSVTP
ncbi:uncharacterized protein LOC143264978 isoform X2 [Megachile rotundata]|uniref:uncharacterized protein LOC143264978 isoform X2 n=1 Tax=Megachile rotundata TaxID=143995 RepID=UPI003FD02BF5